MYSLICCTIHVVKVVHSNSVALCVGNGEIFDLLNSRLAMGQSKEDVELFGVIC